MDQKDLRNMMAQTLNMLASLLPRVNDAFCLSHGTFLALSSQTPKLAVLSDSHYKRQLNSTQASIDQVLAVIADFEKKLNDDSLWSD